MVSISSRYARKLILRQFRQRPSWQLVSLNQVNLATLQFAEYERIDFDAVFGPRQTRANCLCVRKGLTRKAALAQVLNQYKKKPGELISKHVPQTLVISTWDAFGDQGWLKQFGVYNSNLALDECLQEAYSYLDMNNARWVLKPSIASKGSEVVIVRTSKQLKATVSEWPDIREWVLQKYVPNLLLLDGNRKFHLRVFIIVSGAIKVFLLHDYIAFFAVSPFDESKDDDWTHITNAYHQRNHENFIESESFRSSHELPEIAYKHLGVSLDQAKFDFLDPQGRVLGGIAKCLDQVFLAEKQMPNVFQPAPQLFEHFGLDFLVDENLNPWLLEFNSGPDLEQAGDRLQPLIEKLISGLFVLGVDNNVEQCPQGFSLVFDQDWSNLMNGAPKIC